MTPGGKTSRGRNAAPVLITTAISVLASAAPMSIRGPTLLLWNASPSVPVGLYAVAPTVEPATGELAVSDLPPDARGLAAKRRYLPTGVLLIKPVAAKTGTEVCRSGANVFVGGRVIAEAKRTDRLGRPLPVWGGCHVLAPTQIFLMNAHVPDSFDGRYFGPTDLTLLKGRATPLLTVSAPSAR